MFVIIILLSYFLIQRYLLAGCSFNCTAYVGQTDKLVACVCQLEVYSIQSQPVCNMSLRDINVSQC